MCTVRLDGCEGRSTVAHHVLDAADGGEYTLDNLAGACDYCNSVLGGRRAHKTALPVQGRVGGAAPDNVGGSGSRPPLGTRLH